MRAFHLQADGGAEPQATLRHLRSHDQLARVLCHRHHLGVVGAGSEEHGRIPTLPRHEPRPTAANTAAVARDGGATLAATVHCTAADPAAKANTPTDASADTPTANNAHDGESRAAGCVHGQPNRAGVLARVVATPPPVHIETKCSEAARGKLNESGLLLFFFFAGVAGARALR